MIDSIVEISILTDHTTARTLRKKLTSEVNFESAKAGLPPATLLEADENASSCEAPLAVLFGVGTLVLIVVIRLFTQFQQWRRTETRIVALSNQVVPFDSYMLQPLHVKAASHSCATSHMFAIGLEAEANMPSSLQSAATALFGTSAATSASRASKAGICEINIIHGGAGEHTWATSVSKEAGWAHTPAKLALTPASRYAIEGGSDLKWDAGSHRGMQRMVPEEWILEDHEFSDDELPPPPVF